MDSWRIGAAEERFADIVWENEPLPSGELVKLCKDKLSWAKSTTYTVLRKLCSRGLFKNEDGLVSAVMSKEQLKTEQSKAFLQETFDDSLPAFIASFAGSRALKPEEVEELRQLIESYPAT